ncbi:MAG: serine hydrolase [Reichenbachiella sp.]|uniref:serine hydrolase n=1 Tax=Reichenbachiella sp. TaxID=2184521 RepID=UPI0032991138
MKKPLLLLTLVAVLCFQSIAQSSEVDLEALDVYFEKMTKDWDVPSMSIGIVKDGDLVFAKGYGVKEIGTKETPDRNTLYAIASNSKAFTSAIIAQLVEEGKLDWDGNVKDYYPEFELYDPWVTAHTTIRDILSHRVGLGTFSGDVIWYKSDFTPVEILSKIKNIPPAYDFRAGYGYSNLMYITAGEIIREVTGKSWAENVIERILIPLGMDRTITSPQALDLKGNFATPHSRRDEKNIPIVWEDWEEIGALGGLISSVEDLSKWLITNMNHGVNGTDTLFSASSRNLMWTPHNNFVVDHTKPNDFNRHFNGYGLGWGLSDYQGNLRVGHTGGYDGMLTAINMIPDQNLGVIVLTNGMKSPMMAATYYALDQFLGVDGPDWSEKFLGYMGSNEEDARITERKAKRVKGTKPSLDLDKYVGTYHADIYGDIEITLENGKLRLNFPNAKALSATLKHWHFDVWEIDWDIEHAWFSFGTLQFNMDNNLKIERLTFDVPNDDIFFEELIPIRVD